MEAQPPPLPQTFRASGTVRVLTVLTALLFAGLALAFGWLMARGTAGAGAAVAAAAALAAVVLLVVRPVLVARLDFLPASLRFVPGLGAPRELAYADLRGFRQRYGKGGEGFALIPRSPGRRAVTLPTFLGRPAALRAALAARLTDLDAADQAKDLASVRADPALGPDEPSRLAAVARVRTQLRLAVGVLVLATLGSLYPPAFPVAGWALAALPAAVLAIVAGSRGAAVIGGPPKGARPDAGILFLFAGPLLMILGLRSWNVAEYSRLGVPVAACALLVLGACLLAARALRRTSAATYVLLAVFTAAYSLGLVLLVNCGLDRSDPVVTPTVVVGHRISHGKSTNYYVRLRPGLCGEPDREVRVSAGFYRRHPPGSPAEVVLRPGTLAIPWFVLR